MRLNKIKLTTTTTTHFIKKQLDSYNLNSTYPQILEELVEAGRYD